MATPNRLFLIFNDSNNRWIVNAGHNTKIYGDGATPEEAIASAREISNATIFSASEPDVIINKVFDKPVFLQFENDNKFHIVDDNGSSYGAGYEIPDAINHFRKISDAPIDIEDSHAGFSRLCVPEKPDNAEEDSEIFIAMLAELAGMKVTKLFDDNIHFLGYTMEPIDEELRDFLAAESASEKLEEEIVSAMGSYLGDDV